MTRDTAIAQLRHLYSQMISGDVKDTAEAARGLLGPAIEALEQTIDVGGGREFKYRVDPRDDSHIDETDLDKELAE